MSKEREILQRFHVGTSQRNIALGLHVSRNTVAKVIAAYKTSHLSWDVADAIDDDELHHRLYPDEVPNVSAQMPDYDHVHKELLKPGVTLKLLWDEYVATCRSSGQSCIQYSQFCKLYRDYADRHRLTMHIRHKELDRNKLQLMRRTNFDCQGRENAVVAELRQVFPDAGNRNLGKQEV